jgi:hypothetical protein
VLEEFDLAHTALGFQNFFRRVRVHERCWKRPRSRSRDFRRNSVTGIAP